MEGQLKGMTDGQLVAVINAAVGLLADDRPRLDADAVQLGLLQAAVWTGARLQAWQRSLAARIEDGEVAWREHGTSTATWLMGAVNFTHREAAGLVRAGQELDRFPVIGQAARQGVLVPQQAEAITGVLAGLPAELPSQAIEDAQELMVGFAGSHNSAELRRLSRHLLDMVAPEVAEQSEAARLEREHRQAMRDRQLSFTPDHAGSVLIRGSLPVIEAEPLIRIIDSYAAAQRGLDVLDPAAEYVTPAMRRADALMAMVAQHARTAAAPSHGGDRPRIVVSMSYDTLLKAATDNGLIGGSLTGSGEPVPASVLRRMLCDADLLPVVLDGASQPLDVGRTQRLVTPAIRAALELRDRGCVFPGCDKPPNACHAHHRIPWWAGGTTALANLVLLCPHHHGICEPGHDPTADRWNIEFRSDGIPHVKPPHRVDPRQRPRLHARFQTRTLPA